ncbi:hypothetical protein P885DRAFT_64989 [Corynascus similis CBS 632.67]
MQLSLSSFFAAVTTLMLVARPVAACTPGTYACLNQREGNEYGSIIQVCDAAGNWQTSAGGQRWPVGVLCPLRNLFVTGIRVYISPGHVDVYQSPLPTRAMCCKSADVRLYTDPPASDQGGVPMCFLVTKGCQGIAMRLRRQVLISALHTTFWPCSQEVKELFVATWRNNVSQNGTILTVDVKDAENKGEPPYGRVVKRKENDGEQYTDYECKD